MIETRGLSFSYKGGNQFNFPNFQSSSEPTLIIGPSGIGKTTLLHLIAGLLLPTSGDVLWDETPIKSLSNKKLDALRGQLLSIVFQKTHFIESLTVTENILLPLQIQKKAKKKTDVIDLLKSLDIEQKANSKINELSEGEKQRVSIARALITQPKYLLADEPTSSLDDHNTEEVIELLKKQCLQRNCELIIITHDQRLKKHFSNTLNLSDHA